MSRILRVRAPEERAEASYQKALRSFSSGDPALGAFRARREMHLPHGASEVARSPGRRWLSRRILAVVLVLTLLALSACGGGDPEPDNSRSTIGPPDCVNHPEQCQ